jgi:hypothetical protein
MAESATKVRTTHFKSSRHPSTRIVAHGSSTLGELQSIDNALTSPPLPQHPLAMNAVHIGRPTGRSTERRGHARNITAPVIANPAPLPPKPARSASETRSPQPSRPTNEILKDCPTVNRHLADLKSSKAAAARRPVQHTRTTTAPALSRPPAASPDLSAALEDVDESTPKTSSESIGLALGSPTETTFPRKLSLPVQSSNSGLRSETAAPRKVSLPATSEDWAPRVASVWPTPGLASALTAYEAVIESNPRPKHKKWKSLGSFLKRTNSTAVNGGPPRATEIHYVSEGDTSFTTSGSPQPPTGILDELTEQEEQLEKEISSWTSPISPKQRPIREPQNGHVPRTNARPVGLGLRTQTAPASQFPTLGSYKIDEVSLTGPPPPPKDERYLRKVAEAKASAAATEESSKEEPIHPKPNRMQLPKLDIEIPVVHMDRYSVMFNSLLDPEITNSPKAAPLLMRRQINVEKLTPLKELPPNLENDVIQKLQRPMSSPSPATPHFPFVAFPPGPADDSSPVSPKVSRPWQLGRTQTAPGSIPLPHGQDMWRRRKGFAGVENLSLLSPPSEAPFSDPESAFSPTTVASSDDGEDEDEDEEEEVEASQTPLSRVASLKPHLDSMPRCDMIQKELLGAEADSEARDRKDSVMSEQTQTNASRAASAPRAQKQFFMPIMSEGDIAARSMCSPTLVTLRGNHKSPTATPAMV